MLRFLTKGLLGLTFMFLTSACAGPTSPFGPIKSWMPDQRSDEDKNPTLGPQKTEEDDFQPSPEPLEIRILPKRQKIHAASPLEIQVLGHQSPDPLKHLKITYNNIDVTKAYLKRAKITQSPGGLKLNFSRLKLPANRYNNIHVTYRESDSHNKQVKYHPPSCNIYDTRDIKNTGSFKPPGRYLAWIDEFAPPRNVNPSMMAGIIAQESSFNPAAVSWAKAMGLTQVTPIAEQEIIEKFPHFPRHPGVNKYSYMRLRTMLMNNKIDGTKEWRFNPHYSIQGGVEYLKYIDSYWRKEKNAQWLKQLPGDPYVVYTQVLLASYNSGSFRVKKAIQEFGKAWLYHPKLTEAHKYVNKISSFCYHFSVDDPFGKATTTNINIEDLMNEDRDFISWKQRSVGL